MEGSSLLISTDQLRLIADLEVLLKLVLIHQTNRVVSPLSIRWVFALFLRMILIHGALSSLPLVDSGIATLLKEGLDPDLWLLHHPVHNDSARSARSEHLFLISYQVRVDRIMAFVEILSTFLVIDDSHTVKEGLPILDVLLLRDIHGVSLSESELLHHAILVGRACQLLRDFSTLGLRHIDRESLRSIGLLTTHNTLNHGRSVHRVALKQVGLLGLLLRALFVLVLSAASWRDDLWLQFRCSHKLRWRIVTETLLCGWPSLA